MGFRLKGSFIGWYEIQFIKRSATYGDWDWSTEHFVTNFWLVNTAAEDLVAGKLQINNATKDTAGVWQIDSGFSGAANNAAPLSDETFVDKMIGALPQPGVHKVWMSRGTKGHDRSYGPLQDYADELMEKRGYPPSHFQSKVYSRTGHNERSWARYLDEPMRFWLSE